MYLKEYFPFYTTYANPLLYEGERMQDKEFNLMKSYYPGTVQHIQEKIEEECDLMDYEGSRLYDEYPDKYMIYHLSCKIRESMEPEISTQAIREDFLDELIQVSFVRKYPEEDAADIAAGDTFKTDCNCSGNRFAGTPDSYNRLYNINRQKEQ